ncbi:hypothetical protein SAMN04489760_10426 [Syntrophus gentianae]|uniref:Uncharacterized protein n=1 Tax=Syntrophus gentianae TaxID=43775 RepID=A0A1H7VK18_9BACT|nr:hypothetical protein [Syntrophus gentianae]SEM09520.1 hypothetical protein SAMN04489760_10426 [Syntrophus gentianae]
MECKKCGIDLSGREYKTVASWAFCLECFQALMDKAEERKKEPAEPQPTTATEEPLHCLLCEREVEPDTAHEMLGMMLCLECYENLIRKPEIPPRPEASGQEPDQDRSEKPAVMQVRVDFSSPVQCYGCGRQIPAIGSKSFDGHPYCPDCYYRLPEIEARKPKPFPKAEPDRSGESTAASMNAGEQPAGRICSACQRRVLPANLKTIEGFEICLACLTTDPETALEIARIRHRKALERIRKELT